MGAGFDIHASARWVISVGEKEWSVPMIKDDV